MYHLTEAYLMATYLCLLAAYLGALVFGSSVVAPLLIRALGTDASGPVLRAYWPAYHRFAVIAGLAFTMVAAAMLPLSALPLAYTSLVVALAGLMTALFFMGMQLIPAINRARDAGADAQFQRYHRLDVAFVGLGLLAGLLLLISLVYVLPGQFTFWPGADLSTLHLAPTSDIVL